MPSSRGYHSYRGRGSRLKAALAVVLVLVILASLSVVAMSRYISYDEEGRPFMRLPERPEEDVPPPPEEEPNIMIEIREPEPEPEPPVRVLSLPEGALTAAGWTGAAAAAVNSQGSYNAIAITMGNARGTIYFDAASAVRGTVKTVASDTARALETVAASSLHTIARVSGGSCFRVANANAADMGLKNTGGYIFYDLRGVNWLDPAKPAARAYISGLAAELAALGFDEILLTDLGYPTEGKLSKIAYTGAEDRYENVEELLREVHDALADYGVLLSVELPESVILEGFHETAYLRLEGLVPCVDRIYVPTSAGQAETLAQAAAAVSDTLPLIPELSALPAAPEDGAGYLILP